MNLTPLRYCMISQQLPLMVSMGVNVSPRRVLLRRALPCPTQALPRRALPFTRVMYAFKIAICHEEWVPYYDTPIPSVRLCLVAALQIWVRLFSAPQMSHHLSLYRRLLS